MLKNDKMRLSLLIGILLITSTFSLYAQNNVRFLNRVFDEISNVSEIPYSLETPIGSDEAEWLYFDWYEPVGDTMSKRPLVITVFGGAFVTGGRGWCDMIAYADSLSHYGYAVASIDYRLLPLTKISTTNFIRSAYAAAQDVSAAIRFFKGNADTYRIDTNQIFLLGNSAGTIASMYTIWMDEDERPEETFFESGFLGFGGHSDLGGIHESGMSEYLDHSPSVAGLIAQWGGVLDTNIVDAHNNTPVCLIHGTADETVFYQSGIPYENNFLGITSLFLPTLYGSYYLNQRLTSQNVPHEMHIFEGEEHCFYIEDLNTLLPEKLDTCFRIALQFMAQYNTHIGDSEDDEYIEDNEYIEEGDDNVAIDDMKENAITFYPNPIQDILQIEMPDDATDFSIALYNLSGQCLYKGMNQKRIDLNTLPSGLYIVEINGADWQQKTKIVKL